MMGDQVMSILHMGEKQAVGGFLWSSATATSTKVVHFTGTCQTK